jgi:DNA polymerase III delta subunit
MADPLLRLLKGLEEAAPRPVYLVHGDLVLAEPAARRLAEALAQRAGCAVAERRRPGRLGGIFEDLRTYSLFEPAKVVLVVDSALLADRNTAAALLDSIEDALPVPTSELSVKQREAASRLLQALRLFDLNPDRGEAAAVLAELPDWALAGAKGGRPGRQRARPKAQIKTFRANLAELLDRAREAQLAGWAEDELAQLSELAHTGLPQNHTLVLAERKAPGEHPFVSHLAQLGAELFVGDVAQEKRGGWSGLDLLAQELERETGTAIRRDALAELANRTLRQQQSRGAAEGLEAESTTRLAGEYRKLAALTGGRPIELAQVEKVVQDRGQEDVWKILDAIGEGKAQAALTRLRRYLAASDDLIAARLSFFALLAGFCRQLVAVRGMMRIRSVASGERNYPRFKDRLAPALQDPLPTGAKSPLAGLHPFRLHRAYLAAGRLPEGELNRLPEKVLETELLLKGESTDGDAALQFLVASLAGPAVARR